MTPPSRAALYLPSPSLGSWQHRASGSSCPSWALWKPLPPSCPPASGLLLPSHTLSSSSLHERNGLVCSRLHAFSPLPAPHLSCCLVSFLLPTAHSRWEGRSPTTPTWASCLLAATHLPPHWQPGPACLFCFAFQQAFCDHHRPTHARLNAQCPVIPWPPGARAWALASLGARPTTQALGPEHTLSDSAIVLPMCNRNRNGPRRELLKIKLVSSARCRARVVLM